MVFKRIKKKEEEDFDEPEEDEEEEPEPVRKVKPKNKEKVVQVPILLTRADLDKMLYENNIMLREILAKVREED